ncbi:MAG: 2Fe-2S iron-sulfur cluster binding domain-containing protein [Saprospiraceae bacterium]|nr:2Fe-2S iron-sulfur cluster binding domain-containing protein [Saprospiraceae bacterium]
MLHYSRQRRRVEIEPGKTILQHSISEKIAHLHECGGNGVCTTCRVRVHEGFDQLSEPTSLEATIKEERQWDHNVRLGCQAKLLGGPVTVERLIWSNSESAHLQTEKLNVGMGEERDLTILICDMRNFTPMAEKQLNFDLAHILNLFFNALGDPIFMNNGMIYQYAGDEIIALFGVGGDDATKSCQDAVRAALSMQHAIARLNHWHLKEFDIELEIGIGIHHGKTFVGNIGHDRFKQFAVIGDTVNVASRIQGQNKNMGTKLLVSEAVLHGVPVDALQLGKEQLVELKGKEAPTHIYEVKGYETDQAQYLVQLSITDLLQDEPRFSDIFYQHVFSLAPEVRALFPENMAAQGTMLTHMLRGIVNSMSRPQHLQLGLKNLGTQHASYGVQSAHYPVVKQAFLLTIEEILDGEEDERMKRAWSSVLDMVTNMMKMGH